MDGRSETSVVTETVTVEDRECSPPPPVEVTAPPTDPSVLKLRVSTNTKADKKVNWTEGTVDNEHLNRRKSKCCCIYEKPRAFGESSSESDADECENCFGHVEKKKKKKKQNSLPEVDKDFDKSRPDPYEGNQAG